ncbi:hypothetical protein MMSR116_05995 [Methylobacterium mesophilicum SR1.6/6]|uniref:Uncharacterized protein n=1 Tax=Methylobacterium mesophilicum SR1.6/6 TaxID=908290 RepID=A0A6B9FK36_9HYPH|nr:hypothetical protein [Methylobacterium mesophilicum]QGY01505.1 hypothetical protein MMSR116_05995 [Methylobacterium mesophilicum SR1.6/6]
MAAPARIPTATERTARAKADQHGIYAYDSMANFMLLAGGACATDTRANAERLRLALDAAITNAMVARARLDERLGG